MKKKRLLAWALTAVMTVGAGPVTALAADAETTITREVSTAENQPIQITKRVSDDGTEITMEAYVTDKVTTTTTSKPLDIVLVLDVSGSMDEEIGKGKDRIKKIDALKTAVNNFVDKVAENSEEHHVSIVKFAGEKSNKVGNDTYWEGINEYNHSQIVQNLTYVTDEGQVALKQAVDALKPAGSTRADYGLVLAKDVLDGAKNDTTTSGETRGKVVIMFTDGVPTSASEFDPDVAADAINTAKELKDAGAKVFMIGMFGTAPDDDSDTGKYMNAVSSKYPDATATVNEATKHETDADVAVYDFVHGGDGNHKPPTESKKVLYVTIGDAATDGDKYYSIVSDTSSLDAIFDAISSEILNVKADANSKLTDTLTEHFDFSDDVVVGEDGKVSGVTVKKVAKTADGWSDTQEDVTGVTVTVNGKKIEVTGFDYTSEENIVTGEGGYKLVLTFPIQPNPDADWKKGTHPYDTNRTDADNKAGLYGAKVGNEEYDELLEESPQVPVTAYGIIYDGNGADGGSVPTDSKGYLPGTDATVLGKEDLTRDGYDFVGWSESPEGTTIVGSTVSIGNADKTLYAIWSKTITRTEDVTLTYDGNGGTAVVDLETKTQISQKYGKGYPVIVAENSFTREGYDFVGWSDTADGKATVQPWSTFTITENTILYAIWKQKDTGEVTVTKSIVNPKEIYKNNDKVIFEIIVTNGTLDTQNNLRLEEYPGNGLGNFDDEKVSYWYVSQGEGNEGQMVFWDDDALESESVEVPNVNGKSDTGCWAKRDRNNIVTIDGLKSGETAVLYYKTYVKIQQPYNKDDYKNIAVVGDKESEPVYVPVTGIDITKEVVGNTTVKRGDWVLYKIVVENIGVSELKEVKITETPDTKLVDGYFCDKDGKELTGNNVNGNEYTIDELAEAATETLYYTAKVSGDAANGEKLGNHVVVEATSGDDIVRDERDSDKVTVNVPGNNSGGGSHSHRNTTKTEPKQEEVLNKEDHFQYVQGYPDATVRPDANITRAEATVIFFRLLTDSVREKYLDTENSFTDVNAADWFNLGISTMENGGFVNGYKDGSFRPNGYITRAELATIISNFDDLEPVEESKFPDAAGHWAEAYINSAAEKGWLSGYADGLFRPNQLITRAETMSMINRVLERSVDADGLHADAKQWQDNPVGKWYYYSVLEATNPHEYERKDTTDVERWTAITAEKIWEN